MGGGRENQERAGAGGRGRERWEEREQQEGREEQEEQKGQQEEQKGQQEEQKGQQERLQAALELVGLVGREVAERVVDAAHVRMFRRIQELTLAGRTDAEIEAALTSETDHAYGLPAAALKA
ncbi:hypothetical protein VO63_35030 [Streptomyces showdoensis]|uniref:Uncharacterized protein n=1 Tax=Streptomyces showdoensis TaxID=68268 RepID=A0A2P2GCT4_STREW|nr:hypothetical protein VO63_35030 [Streptomyces showdoensis]